MLKFIHVEHAHELHSFGASYDCTTYLLVGIWIMGCFLATTNKVVRTIHIHAFEWTYSFIYLG